MPPVNGPMSPIDELRRDVRACNDSIRDHAKSDEQALRDMRAEIRELRSEQAETRTDVKGLIRHTAAQTVMLENINASVARRAKTESAENKVRRAIRLAWWKALIPAAVGAAGYLLSYVV